MSELKRYDVPVGFVVCVEIADGEYYLAVDLMSGSLTTVSKDANLTPIDFKVVEV